MGIGDALDDRKSQPRISRPSPVAPPEASKNQLALILFDSRTLIEDADYAAVLDDDFHGCSCQRIVDRVLDKVTDRSRQHLRIAVDPHRCIAAAQGDILAFCQRQWSGELRDLGANRSQ